MIYFFFIIATLIGIHQTTICMDHLTEEKTRKEIEKATKKIEYLEEMSKVAKAQQHNEELKSKHIDDICTKKIERSKTEIDRLKSDIHQNDFSVKSLDGVIEGTSKGLTQGISETIQYGGKKIIDRWLDGTLTTAETLMELDKEQDILTKEIQNTKEIAATQRQYLSTPAEVETLKNKTRLKLQNLEKREEQISQAFEQIVAARSKPRQTEEPNKNVSELPAKNKPEEQNSTPEKMAGQPQNLNQAVNEVKAKTTLFAAITASCGAAATKVGKCADVVAGYSFAYITENSRLKETFIGKHATGINRALVATTVIIAAYSAYRLYKAKNQTTDDDDDDIFADDNDY